ncbi:MAG: diadenylate cyclase CdaA [Bacteroidia bacterium]
MPELGFDIVLLRDAIDLLLVSLLLYQLYKLVKGSLAANILLGLMLFYLVYLAVDALELRLLARILGQFIGVGVISLIILFQPEIRRFLLLIGKNTGHKKNSWLRKLFLKEGESDEENRGWLHDLAHLAFQLSKARTGMLVVFARTSELQFFANTGEILDALPGNRLLESIFNKTSPLHDGAVIIANNRVKAAACVLPISENTEIPDDLGMRHRSALGISEHSDAVVLVVSEQTGKVSVAVNGKLESFEQAELLFNRLQALLF